MVRKIPRKETIAFYVTPEDYKKISDCALKVGLPKASFSRYAILKYISNEVKSADEHN